METPSPGSSPKIMSQSGRQLPDWAQASNSVALASDANTTMSLCCPDSVAHGPRWQPAPATDTSKATRLSAAHRMALEYPISRFTSPSGVAGDVIDLRARLTYIRGVAIDDAQLDDVYAARLQEFVARRKKLANALKAEGRREDAKAIEKLSRPPVAAWTVNQIARRQPKLVKDLGRVTAQLKAGGDYAAAASAHRQLLADLRSEAEVVLQQGGHTPTPSLLTRVLANLRAGAADVDVRPMMEAGRLAKEIEATDFASLLAGAAAGSRARDQERTPASASRGGAPRSIKTPSTAIVRKHGVAADERRRLTEARQREREQAKTRAQAERETERKLKALRSAAAAAQRNAEKEARAYADAKQALGQIELRWQAARTAAQTAARALLTAQQESARRMPRTG